MNGLILSVCFLTGTMVSIREAGHEGEGVCGERSSVLTQEIQCQYMGENSRQRHEQVSQAEGVGRKAKELSAYPRRLPQLSRVFCFFFFFSNRKDALVVTKGLPEIPTFREPETLRVNWRAAAEVLGTLGWLPVVTERRERLRERRHLGNCCASLEGDSSF